VLASVAMEVHYDCCGKNVCGGCIHSAIHSGNNKKCPFCNSEIIASTDDESFEEMRKRVEANDVDAMVVLANHYNKGIRVLQDQKKAKELWTQKAAKLGSRDAHYQLGNAYKLLSCMTLPPTTILSVPIFFSQWQMRSWQI